MTSIVDYYHQEINVRVASEIPETCGIDGEYPVVHL